tara:strand:+ start:1050 stop:1232 length:183 start_codon:yes stop_codon:yes gene_type:complete
MWIPILVFGIMIYVAFKEKSDRKKSYPSKYYDPDLRERKVTNFMPYYLIVILFLGLFCGG